MITADMRMDDGSTCRIYFKEEVDFQAIAEVEGIDDLMIGECDDLEVTRCRIGLRCGDFIFCYLPVEEVKTFHQHSDHFVWCVVDTTIDSTMEKLEKVDTEQALIQRHAAACSLIVNHPDEKLRTRMLDEYLKRKAAYVAAIEALVGGMSNEQGS